MNNANDFILMLMGPAVFFLFTRRRKKIYTTRDDNAKSFHFTAMRRITTDVISTVTNEDDLVMVEPAKSPPQMPTTQLGLDEYVTLNVRSVMPNLF